MNVYEKVIDTRKRNWYRIAEVKKKNRIEDFDGKDVCDRVDEIVMGNMLKDDVKQRGDKEDGYGNTREEGILKYSGEKKKGGHHVWRSVDKEYDILKLENQFGNPHLY